MDELARLGVARVRDQVGFGKAWGLDVPGIGFDGDVMFEQGSGLGASVEAPLELVFFRLQSAVDLARRDRAQLLFYLWGEGVMVLGPRQPKREQGFEPYRPRIARHLPNGLQDREGLEAVLG